MGVNGYTLGENEGRVEQGKDRRQVRKVIHSKTTKTNYKYARLSGKKPLEKSLGKLS